MDIGAHKGAYVYWMQRAVGPSGTVFAFEPQVALAAYKNRIIRGFVCQKSVTWHYNDGRVRVFETTNQVLKRYPLCNGMKTGYTEAAGHCLISSASHNGRSVIAVVLGDSKNIWNDSYKLLAFGLSS